MLKAVIFDLDGTLTDCDTEGAKREVASLIAKLTGKPYNAVKAKLDDIHYTFNIKGIYDRNVWWGHIDPHLSDEEKQELTNVYWHHIVTTTSLKPFAELLLETLKQRGLTLVLLTDYDGESFSKRERINLLSIISFFDLVVIAGDDTAETKPSSEPYTYILETLHLAPHQVLMVGDKPEVDLEGARDLGMRTLLLESDYGDEWDHTVTDLPGVLTHIGQLTKQLTHR